MSDRSQTFLHCSPFIVIVVVSPLFPIHCHCSLFLHCSPFIVIVVVGRGNKQRRRMVSHLATNSFPFFILLLYPSIDHIYTADGHHRFIASLLFFPPSPQAHPACTDTSIPLSLRSTTYENVIHCRRKHVAHIYS